MLTRKSMFFVPALALMLFSGAALATAQNSQPCFTLAKSQGDRLPWLVPTAPTMPSRSASELWTVRATSPEHSS